MKRFTFSFLSLGLLIALSAIWSDLFARTQPDKPFQADDPVTTVTVKVDVGAEGADLQEPIALDLGLGFPLWLHSIGRGQEEMEPFGAVAQQVSVEEKVKAGTSATFTFSTSGENHHDLFRTTPQLLAGVRVGDISRIGFASTGHTDWVLAGYEIRINDKLIASSKVNDEEARAKAKSRIDQIDKDVTPIVKEMAEIDALIKTKLATADDVKKAADLGKRVRELRSEKIRAQIQYKLGPRAKDSLDLAKLRLREVEAKLLVGLDQPGGQPLPLDEVDRVALVRQQAILRGMLEGTTPWFVDRDFRSPGRDRGPDTVAIKQVRVTIETAAHTAAGTNNYVYFSVGGHKYLLGSPSRPLTWEDGPQTFDLDLRAGPLLQSDLRVWGLGMLGHPNPQGKAPDRWHPQRLLVEVDGKVAYDSDSVERDRLSLAAIRLVPPVHFDEDGSTLVINEPSAREIVYWEAGKGLGLDESGQPAPLPPTNAQDAPLPEPGVPALPPLDPNVPPTFPEPPLPLPDPWGTGPGGGVGPGPWGGGPWGGAGPWGGGGGPWGGGPGPWGGGPGPWGGGPGPWGGGPGPWGGGGPGDPGNGGAPVDPGNGGSNGAGQPFQIETVRLTAGWKDFDPFKIEWTVTGDDSAVDHYDVSLRICRPDTAEVYSTYLFRNENVSRDLRNYIGTIDATLPIPAAYYFVAPMVVAIPKAGQTLTSNQLIGGARAIFPSTADPNLWIQPVKWIAEDANTVLVQGNFAGASTAVGVRGAWVQPDVKSNTAVPFTNPHPGLHVGLRPLPGDKVFGATFTVNNFTGSQQVLAHLGCLEGTQGAGGTVDVALYCTLTNGGGQTFKYPKVERNNLTSFNPMYIIDRIVNVADVGGAGPYKLDFELRCTNGAYHPALPIGVFGLRLLPLPGVVVPNPTVTDLGFTEVSLCPGVPRTPPANYQGPIPFVKIKNLGPNDIPANLMNLVQVQTRYYTGQYGDGKGDATTLVTVTNPINWTGPFKVGDEVMVQPKGGALPTGMFTTWTKVLCSEAKIVLPATGEISDPQPNNNTYSWEPYPPLVVGSKEAGLYEVILYPQTNFNGPAFVVECKPQLRHKLQTGVPASHINQVKSFKVGSNVQAAFFEKFFFNKTCSGVYSNPSANHFWSSESNSVIVFPKAQARPGGIWLFPSLGATADARFFPLPELQSQTFMDYPDLGPLDNKSNQVMGWRGVGKVQGVYFDNPGMLPPLLGPEPAVTDPQHANPMWFFHLNSLGWKDKVSSLRVQEFQP